MHRAMPQGNLQADNVKQGAFRQWFTNHGGWLHPALNFQSDDVTGLSLFTSSRLESDTTVVRMARNLGLTPVSCRNRILQAFGESDAEQSCIPDLPSPGDWVVAFTFIVKLLQCEQEGSTAAGRSSAESLHPISDYIPYVELLPAEITVPLLFNKEEIQILRGTPLYEDTIERRRRCWAAFIAALPLIHEQAQKCSGVPRKVVQLLDQAAGETLRVGASGVQRFSDLTWAPALFRQWLWAQAIYNSRSFPPSLLLAPQNEVGLLGPVLLPGIDILNHARNKAVTWSWPCAQTTTPESAAHVTVWDYFNDSREPHVAVTLRYTAEAGTQAFNCYGAKSNEEFLAGYGFVVPGGPDDTLTLVLGGSHSASVPQSQDFKSASGCGSAVTLRRPWGQRHYWKRLQAEDSGSGRAPTSLLLELRERLLESESIPSTTKPSLHESWLLQSSLATPSTDSTPTEVPFSKTTTIGPSEIGDSLSRSHEKHQRYVQALHLDGEILETLEELLCAKRRAFKKAQRELNVAENVRADVEAIVAEYRKGQEVLFAEAINWTRSTMEELIDVIDRTSEQQDY